ncbi:MAG: murein biosynthesis integral membrane protein MurJ [Planctomycetota bacterium]
MKPAAPEYSRPTWARRRSVARVVLAVYVVLLATLLHLPQLDPVGASNEVPGTGGLPFDKTAHVGTFGLLGLLVVLATGGPGRAWWPRALAVLAAGLAVAGFKEITQTLVGRSGSVDDAAADGVGLVLGVAAAWVVGRWWYGAGDGDAADSAEITAPAASEGFVGHARLVAGLTLVSRVTGLVRDAVLAGVFGATVVLDAFLVGFIVPNLFRRLFGEGALTAAFIPRYTRLLADDPTAARRFASVCVVALVLLLAGVTLVGELGLWWLSTAVVETEKAALAVRLTMWMLPYAPMVCGVALLGAVLQVHRRFGPAAAAPVLLNLTVIGAAVLGAATAGQPGEAVRVAAAGVLVAGLLQLMWLGGSVAWAAPLTASFAGTGPALREMLRKMGPVVIGLGVFQLNTLLDAVVAFGLSKPEFEPGAGAGAGAETFDVLGRTIGYPLEAGAVTTLSLAQRLYQFPLGVFGVALATAIFPALAAAAGRKSGDAKPQAALGGGEFGEIFRRGVRLTLYLGLPASVGLILVRVPLVRVFFEWNRFTTEDALRCAAVLAGYGSAVWAYALTHVATKAFYAADDTATPLRVSLAMVGLNVLLNLTLIWPLGVAGLAWSTAICATLQAGLLVRGLRRHVDRPVDASVWRSVGRTATLCVAMAVGVGALVAVFDPATLGKTESVALLAGAVGLGGAVVVGGGRWWGMPETRELMSRGS